MKTRHAPVVHAIVVTITFSGIVFLLDLADGLAQGKTQDDVGVKRSLAEALDAEEPVREPDQPDPDQYVPPDKIVREAFDPPPGAKSLSKRNLWIDREKQRVYLDGYVILDDGLLEMFACPMGTKEHEAIVASLARSREVHTALLAIGARPGTPVEHLPRFVPATGQRIRVWVCYRDAEGKFVATDARRWIRKTGTDEQMESDWVFAGSGFWKDPSDGREYYRADGGDMICVSNFNSAMMDVPIASSAEGEELQFSPFTKRIPKPGTPVRLILVPIPIPSDKPDATPKVDANEPPTEEVLPPRSGRGNSPAAP